MRSKLAIAYLVFGVGTNVGYGVISAMGWEPAAEKPEVIPADIRSSPGGYRSWHFWYPGFQGGK